LYGLYCCNKNITLKMAGTPVETCGWEYCAYNTSWVLRCIWLVILCGLDLTLMHGRQKERVYKVLMCLIFLKHKSSGLCSMPCAILSSVAFIVVQYFSTLFYSTFCPHSVLMCFVWIWEQTAIISLYSINWLVFITAI